MTWITWLQIWDGIGALSLVLLFVLHPRMRTHPIIFILWEAGCTLAKSMKVLSQVIINAFELARPGWFCWSQAIWGQFFQIASLTWNVVVCINLFLSVFSPFIDTYKYYPYYHVLVWGTALGSTIITFGFTNGVEPDFSGRHAPCGLANGLSWNVVNGIGYVLPLWVFWTIALLSASYAIRVLRRGLPASQEHRLVVYELLFLVLYSPVLAYPLMYIVGADSFSTALQDLGYIGSSTFESLSILVWLSLPGFPLYSIVRLMCCHCGMCRRTCPCLPCHPDNMKKWHDDRHASVPSLLADDLGIGVDQWDHTVIVELFRKEMISGVLVGLEQSMAQREKYEFIVPGSPSINAPDGSSLVSYDQVNMKEVQPFENSAVMIFTDHAPAVFADIRAQCGISPEQYAASMNSSQLSASSTSKFSEGRSGSFFFVTDDGKMILKAVTAAEVKVLRGLLPSLHRHYRQYPDSLIVRLFGWHSIRMQEGPQYHFIVMDNLFSNPSLKVTTRYDIKGSDRSAARESTLLLDGDVNRTFSVGPALAQRIEQQLRLDAELLEGCGIMDYSLLLGVAEEIAESSLPAVSLPAPSLPSSPLISSPPSSLTSSTEFPVRSELRELRSTNSNEIFCIAVIDILQDWSWIKWGEKVWKQSLARAEGSISSVPPDVYKTRFVSRVSSLFV